MKKTTHKQLLSLIRKAEYVLGYFPEKSANWDQSGYQLVFGWNTPIKANGKKIGKRSESHVVSFGRGGFAPTATTFSHFSYGEADAIKLLFAAEVKACAKRSETPTFDVGPTLYGTDRASVQATIPGCDVVKTVYTVAFRNIGVYLPLFGSSEPANRWGHDEWQTDCETESVDSLVCFYEFDNGEESS